MIEKFFKLRENNTNIKTEIIAGITTFMTMAYIIFVQPAVLKQVGMDFGAVMTATCISSALAIFIMAFTANYPIALAPGMGHNFFFAYTVCLGMGIPWQVALGANCISGVLFVLLSSFGFREKIINSISPSLKNAIACGIGLFIAFIGFQWSGIVVAKPGTMVGLGNFHSAPVLLSCFGIIFIFILSVLRVKGAILIGIILSTIIALPFGIIKFHGVASAPPSVMPTLFQLDVIGAFQLGLVTVIFTFFFLDLFDTVGTVIGLGEQAGFIVDGKLPRAKQVLLADAYGTVIGTLVGTSTITSYIESSAGVASGGKTGLTNIITGSLFLISLFFYPLVQMIGGGCEINGQFLYPITAPALIIVGSMMMKNVIKIEWNDLTEAIPAFLTLVIMPFTYSITEGISIGFISYTVLKLVANKGKEVHPIIYIFSALFLLRYIYLQM